MALRFGQQPKLENLAYRADLLNRKPEIYGDDYDLMAHCGKRRIALKPNSQAERV